MTDLAFVVAIVTIDPNYTLAGQEGGAVNLRRVPWSVGERALNPRELHQRIEATGAPVACIANDVPQALALEVARLLDEAAEPTGVVLLRQPTPEMWREAARSGIRTVITPDAAGGELRSALAAEVARVMRIRGAREELGSGSEHGRIVVVLSPKGGSGKTMLATNLAVALATSLTSDVAVVDLDCVFGDIASVLGLVPDRTIGQLAMLPSFDSTMLKVFLTRHEASGLYVLAGSGLPEEGEAVTPEIAGEILTVLARDMSHVVVDTAAGLDERALAAVDVATDLVLLASLDVASIRNLGKEIDALDRMESTSARRHFVLNRADARVGLEIADVEAAIGMKASAALPSSRVVPLSMNQGKTLVISDPDSPVAKELIAFARTFMPTNDAATSTERQRRFFKRRP